jgi:hypothetical protein
VGVDKDRTKALDEVADLRQQLLDTAAEAADSLGLATAELETYRCVRACVRRGVCAWVARRELEAERGARCMSLLRLASPRVVRLRRSWHVCVSWCAWRRTRAADLEKRLEAAGKERAATLAFVQQGNEQFRALVER